MQTQTSSSSHSTSPLMAQLATNVPILLNAAFIISLLLAPIMVLPAGDNFLIESKVLLILGLGLGTGLAWIITTLARKSLQLTISPFILPALLFIVSALVSSFMSPSLPAMQLLGWGGTYIAYATIILLGSSIIPEKSKTGLPMAMALGGALIGLSAVAELVNLGPSRFFNQFLGTQFPASPLFSLSGSPLIGLEVLILALVAVVVYLVTQVKGRNVLLSVAILPIGAGIVSYAYTLYNAAKTSVLFVPYSTSWMIAIDAFKTMRTAFIGAGPESYTQVYLQLKPAFVNVSNYWDLQFGQGSNMPLSLIPTMGMLGLAAWVLLAIIAIRSFTKSSQEAKPAAAVLLASLVLQLFFPPSQLVLLIQAMAVVYWIVAEKNRLKDVQLHAFTVQVIKSNSEVQRVPQHTHIMVYLMTLVSALILGVSGYWVGRLVIGDYYSFRANLSMIKNDLLSVYNRQQKMVVFMPYLPAYRRSYSNTNMSVALALSNSKEASDKDKEQVGPLVQQAIREAKLATTIEPQNSVNWVNLARVYSNLIGSIEGAENWSVAAYNQGLQFSPNDPILSLELGGVLFRIKQYQEAARAFEKAVALKPDWSNAYYSLANAYRQTKEPEKAVTAYQDTITILKSKNTNGENDQTIAGVQTELDEVSKEVKQASGSAKTTGTTKADKPAAAKTGATVQSPDKVAPAASPTVAASPSPATP
jgi:tetratricopeptide (TPR) repeat protein